MQSRFHRILPTLLTVVSGAALVFLAGVILGHLNLPPGPQVKNAIRAMNDLKRNGEAYFLHVPKKHLGTLRYDDTGTVTTMPDRMAPGVTFMTGLFGEKLGARLYAADGTLIYEWPVDFFQIAPDKMAYAFDALIHGDHLYPNGDFVANLDGRGIVRVSACGEILWRNHDRSHHALFADDEGFLWAPIYGPKYKEPALADAPFYFDRVARFDPGTGTKLDEIDLVKALIDSDAQGLALGGTLRLGDMMHLNEVEILSAEMADAFPGFVAGDILLSSRHFSQIWVLDGTTHAIKWWHAGPMIGQHDPDFQPDGTITLYDNRPGGFETLDNDYLGSKGGSRIIKIDVETRNHQVVYMSDTRNSFYSPGRGKHQVFKNGNILITETDAGRAFEVTPEGEVVWSFINGWDETRVGWLMSATRYPSGYAAIGETTCPDK